MSNDNKKEILNEITDLRKNNKTPEELTNKKKKGSIQNTTNMEDLVPVVEIKEEATDNSTEEVKEVSNETTSLEKKQNEIVVLSKKDKLKKFLNLKEKQEKPTVDEDAKKARGYAWLAYILFFIPLFINRKNSFVRFHANEGLEINLIDFIGLALTIIGALIKPTSFITILLVVVGCGLLTLTLVTKVFMIIHAIRGIRKNSPWFFNLTIID